MASVSVDKKTGRREIGFTWPAGKRNTLYLGKVTAKDADAICTKIENILAAKDSQRAIDAETAKWIAALTPKLADKLAGFDLIPPREHAGTVQLGPFLDQYFAKRSDVKPATQIVYQRVKRHLVTFFKPDKLISAITDGDADDWVLYLKNTPRWKLRGCSKPEEDKKSDGNKIGLAENTVRRHIGCARQFMKVAVRHKIIETNPFEEHVASVVPNAERYYFITPEQTQRLLAACTDAEWQLIIALARFGGLRTPSETFALTWQSVDWENSRITVLSPKTEHHVGHASRVIPIFPELRPYLEASRAIAGPGAMHLVTSYRDAKQNLRTQFERIIKRAGLEPWPKLFQNLRSSRETELGDHHPIQAVVYWMGNSEIVARKHYLQVTEEHFRRGVEVACSEPQKALQQAAVLPRSASQTEPIDIPYCDTPQQLADSCDSVQKCSVGGTGLEPVTPSV